MILAKNNVLLNRILSLEAKDRTNKLLNCPTQNLASTIISEKPRRDSNKGKISNLKLNIYKYQKTFYNMSNFDRLFLESKSRFTRNEQTD